jgi:hypothetical protein
MRHADTGKPLNRTTGRRATSSGTTLRPSRPRTVRSRSRSPRSTISCSTTTCHTAVRLPRSLSPPPFLCLPLRCSLPLTCTAPSASCLINVSPGNKKPHVSPRRHFCPCCQRCCKKNATRPSPYVSPLGPRPAVHYDAHTRCVSLVSWVHRLEASTTVVQDVADSAQTWLTIHLSDLSPFLLSPIHSRLDAYCNIYRHWSVGCHPVGLRLRRCHRRAHFPPVLLTLPSRTSNLYCMYRQNTIS